MIYFKKIPQIFFLVFRLLSQVILIESFLDIQKLEANKSYSNQKNSIQEIILGLSLVPEGRELIDKAKQHWNVKNQEDLDKFIFFGKLSRTDAVLTRYFNPLTGKEDKVKETSIYIASNQDTLEQILDLSHELVHATSRETVDPYDPGLNPIQYIHLALEGSGGEIEAVFTECQVAKSLKKLIGTKSNSELVRCKGYDSKEKIKKDFYKIGKWYSNFIKKPGHDVQNFPDLSPEASVLYSSISRNPYPVALYNEFTELNEMACKNTKQRLMQLSFIQSESKKNELVKFLNNRCLINS